MRVEQPITILLVEDDEEFRALLEAMLEDEGYQVLGASSGELALEIAGRTSFDLVVTDVKLGGIDGLDTLAELKRGRSELQSLVITGYATEADSIRAISLGVGKYLRKPFKLPDFLRAVEETVQHILSERTKARFMEAVLRTALWGLESLSVPFQGEVGLVVAARAGEQVARGLGMSAQEARQVRLAVLAAGVRQAQADVDVPFLLEILPRGSTWLVQRLEHLESEGDTEEERVAQAALRLARQPLNGPWEMGEGWRQRFEQALAAEPATEVSSGGLMALARALETSGDFKTASSVLSRLEGSGSVQALLSKARMAVLEGDHEQAGTLLEKAENTARGLRSRCEVRLEGGIVLAGMDEKEKAAEWLASARDGFSELQDGLEKARAELALASATNAPSEHLDLYLRQLLSPTGLEHLLKSASWLFPYLIRQGSEQANRAVHRIARDVPQAVCRSFRTGSSTETKLEILDVVKQVGTEGYDDLLQDVLLEGEPALQRAARTLLTSADSMRMAPILRLYSLGTMATWVGERQIPDKGWTGRMPALVLTYLAQNQGSFLTQDHLIDLFWDGSRKGNKSLNQTLVTIRNTLRSPDWPDKIDYVARKANLIGINPEQTVWHDATVLKETLAEAHGLLQAGKRAEAAELLERAVDLDRGPYLENCFEDWALGFRTALETELVARLCDLAEIRLDQSLPQLALDTCRRVLEKDPFSTRALEALLRSYLDLGRPEESIRSFERVEPQLKRELGIEPSIEMVKLYHRAKLGL